jgi:hypothetical protein
MNRARSATIALMTGAALAGGQTPAARRPAIWSDSSPESVVAFGAKGFPNGFGLVSDILRQLRQYPAALRAELLERTTIFAIAADDTSGSLMTAMVAISMAGHPASALGGTPDSTALYQLLRIHREAKSRNARLASLSGIARQVNPYRALPYLREAAVEANETAWLALREINGLATDTTLGTREERSRAEATLRSIWESDSVGDQIARNEICDIAVKKGFLAPPGHFKCVARM